jgi:hypothetical protein
MEELVVSTSQVVRKEGQSSRLVLDSAETGRLVRALRRRQTAARLEAAGPAR